MRVLLVEMNDSHDDGLLSWMLTLQELDIPVGLACTAMVRERIDVKQERDWIEVPASRSGVSRFGFLLQLRTHVVQNRVTHVVFNTASGTWVWLACILLPRSVHRVGILHYVRALVTSTSQKRITEHMDAYVVISPHVLKMIRTPLKIPVHVVPQTAPLPSVFKQTTSDGLFRVAIPGSVDQRRRAYADLFRADVMEAIPQNIHFVVVGNAGTRDDPRRSWFYDLVEPYRDRITVYDHMLTHTDYHAAVAQCALVMPLLHPGTQEYDDFMNTKSSGAFTLAWTYQLPLLLEFGFAQFEALHSGASFYTVPEIAQSLSQAVQIYPQSQHSGIERLRLEGTQRALS